MKDGYYCLRTDRLKAGICCLISGCLLASASASWAPAQTQATGMPLSRTGDVNAQVQELRALVEKLQARVEELEKRSAPPEESASVKSAQVVASSSTKSDTQVSATTPGATQPQTQAQTKENATPSKPVAAAASDFLNGATLNLLFDGYYGYNFNNPIGRVNLLRAYDVSSNAFSINQAGLVLERAANPDEGKRFGLRLDFQYGQATETLQGNPANEPRPDIYRNIFQAYGTYVAPVGKGLTLDFGKFANSLGMEGNYSKDQINYSRSYWFNFLPFYHMGVRANYKFSDRLAVNYWIVNGTQQTEPFNGFKDQFFGLAIQPSKKITWNVNYYLGQEHPDVLYFASGGAPAGSPTQQGVPFQPITNSPGGKLHIFDTYATWQTTPKLTLAAEADYVIERVLPSSASSHADGGAGYLQYQFNPKFSVAARAGYLSDRGGLFSGTTQALKETTFTTKYALADGLLLFAEWRRDSSNHPFFYTNLLGVLKTEQNTAMLGLVWWLGGKQGSW